MSVLSGIGFGGDGASTPGYDIGHSLRFSSARSTYITRTPISAGNRKIWTWVAWIKRGNISGNQCLFEAGTSATTRTIITIDSSNRLSLYSVGAGAEFQTATSAVLRDPSAWYQLIVAVDTTKAVEADRIKFYINGTFYPRITTYLGGHPSLNADLFVNSTVVHRYASVSYSVSTLFDGYFAEPLLIDGQYLDPSYFGEADTDGNWVPKAYTGTYGTAGYFLPFNNATSLATLTADASGNGNNWTANNISLTAGVTYDWMDDTPSNNFPVYNAIGNYNGLSSTTLISQGNLQVTSTTTNSALTYSTILLPSTGKFYFESQFPTSYVGGTVIFGVGSTSTTYSYYQRAGTSGIYGPGGVLRVALTINPGDIVGFACDVDANTVGVYVNNVLQYTETSVSIAGSGSLATLSNTNIVVTNFGQRPFTYTPPSGFAALCTKNLPTPAILDGDQHMETFTYLGNGGGLQVGEIQRKLEPYSVSKSLRFRASASAYLSRTFGVAGSRRKWTWSGWVKRGSLSSGSVQTLFMSSNNPFGAQTYDSEILIADRGQLRFLDWNGSYVCHKITVNGILLDISQHYHIVVAVNTEDAIAEDRVKMWVDGVRITSFSATNTNFAINSDTQVNRAASHYSGVSRISGSTIYSDGYLSQVHFIDGQALTPGDFGQTDGNGYWVPKQYTGTYGTNGFKLDFADTTSVATLGNDVSGNGNNWAVNNVSLTAGATYDSMVDVPGNSYAVSNALDPDRASITTSDGNLTLVKATAANSPRAASTLGATSGKFYAEITWATMSADPSFADYFVTGVTTKENWVDTSNGYNSVTYLASDTAGGLDGQRATWSNGAYTGGVAYGTGYYINGSVIGIALDLDARTVTFYNNGVSQGALSLPPTNQPWYFYNTSDGTNNSYTAHWNFGQRPFAYTPPSGFVALSENNIPLDTGNMEYPGLVWIKNRSASQNHAIFDVARGKQVYLSSDTTSAETTDVNSLLEFNKEGFLLGSSSAVNTLGNNYVAWAWKLPQTGVSNTAGSITSTVYANTLAGISAVSYTGNSSTGATIGHGLGVAPKMIIARRRDATSDWAVWHSGLTAVTGTLYLDLTVTQTTYPNRFDSTGITSSVFKTGSQAVPNEVNASGGSFLAYCFAEVEGFSRIGSYTGNGSADGPFVYCGFRPRFVMIKSATVVSNWVIWDTARDTFNVMSARTWANLPNAESTANPGFDITANGFKIRDTTQDLNTNAGTYIFLAFAETPFKYARAR